MKKLFQSTTQKAPMQFLTVNNQQVPHIEAKQTHLKDILQNNNPSNNPTLTNTINEYITTLESTQYETLPVDTDPPKSYNNPMEKAIPINHPKSTYAIPNSE
eukprot:239286_1